MNYGELRTTFKDMLDRDDCTDTLADRFISLGLRRIERLLRTPIQRTSLSKTIDNTWPGYEPIPVDFLGLHEVTVNGKPLHRITQSQTEMMDGFQIDESEFYFHPDLKEGDELKIIYYNEFFRNVEEGDVTDYSLVLTDVAVYAALVFAADHFIDERKVSWEGTLQSLVSEVQLMADNDAITGGFAIQPYGGGIA